MCHSTRKTGGSDPSNFLFKICPCSRSQAFALSIVGVLARTILQKCALAKELLAVPAEHADDRDDLVRQYPADRSTR
jgi:hypothetical protein